MANYDMMIRYINMVDKDIEALQAKPGSKPIVTRLIKLQEYTKAEWAVIHSIVKSMNDAPNEECLKKTQQLIEKCFDLNMTINKYFDDITKLCEKKHKKGNELFLNYLFNELYFDYSVFLDAMHFMGLYYVPAETFPFTLSDVYLGRKVEAVMRKHFEAEGGLELDP
jgi:hypothetical protein